MSNIYPCYTDVWFKVTNANSIAADGTKTPYTGTLTFWYLPYGAATPESQSVDVVAGAGSVKVYLDTPGPMKYCFRKEGDVHGGIFDQWVTVKESAFPETVTP